ncbi:MAG: DNA repair protein RecO [Treponema sp.]|nr:DNA repair protein RecO [Treponema sp.]
MARNYVTNGIVLAIKPLGENNSSVCILTEEQGIIFATLYGGHKSKLRSLVSLWNSGVMYLYCKDFPDVSKNVKISDFDVKNYHLSFREDLYKMYAASLASEIVIKTQSAGNEKECFTLLLAFFTGLEHSSKEQCESGLLRFIWRYLELLGLQADTENCSICGKALLTSKEAQDSVSYNIVENGFCCKNCKTNYDFTISAEALNYLYNVSTQKPQVARELKLNASSLQELKRLLLFLAEQCAGTKLKTLQTGIGII